MSIVTQTNDRAASITIEIGKDNALGKAQLAELSEAIDSASKHDVPLLVLRSGGEGAFCAGADLSEFRSATSMAEYRELFDGFARLLLSIRRARQIVIARAQGSAVGGGVGILACADYVVGTRAVSVRLSELTIGIGPYVIGPAVERKIGTAHFSALSLDAQPRDAEWARRVGLLSQLVETSADLDPAIDAFIATTANTPLESVFAWKQTLWEGTDNWPELLTRRAMQVSQLSNDVRNRRNSSQASADLRRK